MKDEKFLGLTSELRARAYVKDKYKEEKQRNKFVALDTFAKDAYYLNKVKSE